METQIHIPPPILQSFNTSLLSSPCPKFHDDCETLWKIYQYIIHKLKPKASKNAVWLQKIERLEKQFLELYERAKAKEDEFQKETGESFMQPYDCFRKVNRYRPWLLGRLKFKSETYTDSYNRKNNEI